MTLPDDRPDDEDSTAAPEPQASRVLQSIFPVCAIVFALVFLNKAHEIGFGTTTAEPVVMICAVLPLGLISLVTVLRPRRRGKPAAGAGATRADAAPSAAPVLEDGTVPKAGGRREGGWPASAAVLIGLVLLIAGTYVVGLLAACGLFLLGLMAVLGYRRPLPGLAIAAGMVLFIWLGFERFLAIPLPIGIWGF